MNPIFAFFRSLFESLWSCISLSLIMLLISAILLCLIDFFRKRVTGTQSDINSSSKPLIILTLIQMFILIVLIFPAKYEDYTSSSYIEWKIAERYERDYPGTWSYICKYSDDPYEYIVYYDRIWGDLQKYNGDGIVFDTLSSYEQAKVNFPSIGEYIYYTSGSKTYHSTSLCYSLLRSDPSRRLSKYAYMYEPCSKCVGD